MVKKEEVARLSTLLLEGNTVPLIDMVNALAATKIVLVRLRNDSDLINKIRAALLENDPFAEVIIGDGKRAENKDVKVIFKSMKTSLTKEQLYESDLGLYINEKNEIRLLRNAQLPVMSKFTL